MTKIPCTVAVITHNVEITLGQCLEPLRDFAELIVCDGGSTDRTLDIACSFGARIIKQNPAYLDQNGKIVDFGGVRNQTLDASTQPWFFYIDSDEIATSELVAEIRNCCSGSAAAYWVPRRVVWDGRVIRYSTLYPNQQMRLFAKEAVGRFMKQVHERIHVLRGAEVKTLSEPMLVPLETDREKLWRKWNRYIQLEANRLGPLSVSEWLYIVYRNARTSLRYLVSLPRILLCHPKTRLPLWRELDEHLYNFRVVVNTMNQIRFFNKNKHVRN